MNLLRKREEFQKYLEEIKQFYKELGLKFLKHNSWNLVKKVHG